MRKSSELIREQRIKAALLNKPSRSDLLNHDIGQLLERQKSIVVQKTIRNQNRKRFVSQTDQSKEDIPNLWTWLGNDGDYYLCFGGAGDALLVIALCYNNPLAKVVFFSNENEFAPQFFKLFNINFFLHGNIIGKPLGKNIYYKMLSMHNFRLSAHLPDDLNFGDWTAMPYKYKSRMQVSVPWIELLGKKQFKKPTVIISPTGSHQTPARQRYITPQEYTELMKKYLDKGFTIYTTGSDANIGQYGLFDNPDCFWLTAEELVDYQGKREPIELKNMLQYINGATEVVSMDTWLKTYTLLCGIPTKIIKTRWNGHYRMIGTDVSDGIFLNKDIWPSLDLYTIEELLA